MLSTVKLVLALKSSSLQPTSTQVEEGRDRIF